MTDTYTCERCKGVFEKGWTDEEAAAEAQQLFGDLSEDDKAVLCEDCFQALMKWLTT